MNLDLYSRYVQSVGTDEDKQKLVDEYRLKHSILKDKQDSIPSIITNKMNTVNKATIVKMYDADTFDIQDNQGNISTYRTSSEFNIPYDAIDNKENILNSPYKQKTQKPFLEKIFNKPFEQITDEEIQNYKNYQSQIAYLNYGSKLDSNNKLFIDNQDIASNFNNLDINQQFNPNQQYNFNPEWFNGLEINLEDLGTDKYGRRLGKISNLNLDKSTEDLAYDIKQNTGIDLVKFEKQLRDDLLKDKTANLKYTQDTWEYLGDLVDSSQASIDRVLYGLYSFGRSKDIPILSSILQSIGSIRDFVVSNGKKDTYDYFYNNPENRDILLKLNAGVSTTYLDNYNNKFNSMVEDFDKGNYFSAIMKGISIIPEALTDSIGDIALMTSGGIAGGAVKAGKIAKTLFSKLLSTSMITTSQLGTLIEDYKINNNGKDIPNEDLLLAGASLFVLNGADVLAVSEGAKLLFNKAFGKQLTETIAKETNPAKKSLTRKLFIDNPLLATGAFTGETVQETLQGGTYEYFSQNQDNKQSFTDIITSSRQLAEGILGGLVGGSITLGGSTLATGLEGITKGTKKISEKISKNKNKNTEDLPEAQNNNIMTENDTQTIVAINDVLKRLNDKDLSTEDFNNIKSFTKDLANNKYNSFSAITQSKIDTLTYKTMLKDYMSKGKETNIKELLSDTDFNPEGITNPEELLLKLYYYSDKDNTEEQEIINKIAKDNNIDTNLFKNYDEVDLEAKYGERGYKTYESLLKNFNIVLNNQDLSKEDKLKLEQEKEDISNKLNKFTISQFNKLERINNGLVELSENKDLPTVEFKQYKYDKKSRDKGFINKSDIINGDFNSNTSIYKVINATIENISESLDILKNNTDIDIETNINDLNIIKQTILDSINNIKVQNNKDKIDKYSTTKKEVKKKEKPKENKKEEKPKTYTERYNEAKTEYEKEKIRQEYIKEANLDDLNTYLNNMFNENILVPLKVRDINIDFKTNKNNIKNNLNIYNSKLMGYSLSYILDIVKSLPNIVKLTPSTTKKLYYTDLNKKIERDKLLDKLNTVINNYSNINTVEELKQWLNSDDTKEVFNTIRTFLDTKARYYNEEYKNENSEVPKTYSNYYRKMYGNINNNISNVLEIVNKSLKENKSLKDLYKEYKPKSTQRKLINKYLKNNKIKKENKIKEQKNKNIPIKNTELTSKDTLKEKDTNIPKEEKVSVETKSNTIDKDNKVIKRLAEIEPNLDNMYNIANGLSQEKWYNYKKLPEKVSKLVIEFYKKSIPEEFKLNGDNKALYDKEGNLITNNYDRIVIGDYGAFIEYTPLEEIKATYKTKKGQEYRETPKYSKTKYNWKTIGNSNIKIYEQKNTVDYADYKSGKYYVALNEVYFNNNQKTITNEEITNEIENKTTNLTNIPNKSIDEVNDEIIYTPSGFVNEEIDNNESITTNNIKPKKETNNQEDIDNITDENVILYNQKETEQQISKLYTQEDVKTESVKKVEIVKEGKNSVTTIEVYYQQNNIDIKQVIMQNKSIVMNNDKMVVKEDEEGNPVKEVYEDFKPYKSKQLNRIKPLQRSKVELDKFINNKDNNALKIFNNLENLLNIEKGNNTILSSAIDYYTNNLVNIISKQEKLIKEKEQEIDNLFNTKIKEYKEYKDTLINMKNKILNKIVKQYEYYNKNIKNLENYKGKEENKNIKIQEHKDKLKQNINDILDKNKNQKYYKLKYDLNIDYNSLESINKAIEKIDEMIEEYNNLLTIKYDYFYSEKNKIKAEINSINKKIKQNKKALESELSINNLLKNIYTEKNINNKLKNKDIISNIIKKIKSSDSNKSLFSMFNINKEHPEVVKTLNDFLDTISLNGKTSFIETRMSNNEPALALIFKNLPDTEYLSKEKVLENIDVNTIMAIDYSVAKFITLNRSLLHFSKRNVENIDNIDNKTIYENLKETSQSAVINALGNIIVETLGITYDKTTSTETDWLKLKRNLGLYGLYYATNKGYLSINRYKIVTTISKYDKERTFYSDYNTVIDITNMYDRDYLKAKYELLGLGRIVDKKELSTEPIKDTKVNIAKGFVGKETSNLQNKAHEQARNTPYIAVKPAIEYIKENIDIVKKYLGYTENIEDISIKEVKTEKEGLNLTIDMSVNHILNMTEDETYGDKEYYFDTFAAVNGRLFIDSNTINPQTDKFHRFLVVPYDKDKIKPFDFTNNYDKAKFSYALGQAFGLKVDKMNNKQILELFDKLSELTYQEVESKFRNGEELYFEHLDLKLEVEEVSHFIQGLMALKDYETMVSLGKTELNTILTLETDSTTSGVFLKLLQLSFLETYKDEMEQVGIFQDKNMTINDRKSDSNNLDIYEGVAKYSKKLSILSKEELENLLKNTYNELDSKLDKDILNKKIKESIEVYSFFKDLLPEVDDNGKVSKALRNIFKNPIMTFFYMISGKTLIKNVSSNIQLEIFTEYAKILQKNEKDLTDREKLVKTQIDKFINSLKITYVKGVDKELIKSKSLLELIKDYEFKDIYVKVPYSKSSVSLSEYFSDTVGFIYGSNIFNTLNERYGALRGSSVLLGLINNVIVEYVNSEINDYIREGKTIEEVENYIKNNIIYPSINAPFSNNKFQGIVSLNKTEINETNGNTYTFLSNNNVESNIIKSLKSINEKNGLAIVGSSVGSYEYVGSSVALPAITTHYIDSAIISLVLTKFKINTVHDAVVRPANMIDDVSYYYNKASYEVSMNYNVFKESKNLLDEIIKNNKEISKHKINIPISSISYINKFLETKEVQDYLKKNKSYSNKLNKYIKQALIPKDNDSYITLYPFQLSILLNLVSDITDFQKNKFKVKDITISNMDGLDTSKYNIRNDNEISMIKEAKIETENLLKESSIINTDKENNETIKKDKKSNPNILKYFNTETEEDNNIIESRLLKDGEERVRLFDELIEKTDFKDNPHIKELRELLSNLNSLRLEDLILDVVNNSDDYYDVTQNKIIISKFENSPQSRYSNSAVRYAHEMIHAVTAFALDNAEKLGITDYKNKLFYLYQLASKHIKPEDFLPENSINPEEDLKKANEIYNYIFNNKDKDYSLRGLLEFIAYGLTDERIVNKLKQIEIKENNRKKSVKEIIKEVISNIFKLIIPGKNKTIQDIFPNFYNTIIGNTGFKDKNAYDSLYNLTQRIIKADNKALKSKNSFAEGLKLILEGTRKYAYEPLNNTLSRILKNITTIGDKTFNINDEAINIIRNTDNKTIAMLKVTGKTIAYSLISKKARQVLPNILSLYGMGTIGEAFRGYNSIGRFINEVRGYDEQGNIIQEFSSRSRQIDKQSKGLSMWYRAMFEESFKDDDRVNGLNEEEQVALTDIILKTDLQFLDKNIDDIIKLLKDDKAIDNEIEEQLNIIKKYSKTEEQLNYYLNSSLLLVNYMLTGNINSLTTITAKEIADRAGTVYRFNADKELVNAIDKYVSLQALKNTSLETRKLVSTFKKEGLDFFIKSHKSYIEGSTKEVNAHTYQGRSKGYIKNIADNTYDIRIGLLSNRDIMAKKGFKLFSNEVIGKLDNDSLVLYKDGYRYDEHRNGAAFMYSGYAKLGTSMYDYINSEKELINKNINETNKINKITKQIENNRVGKSKLLEKKLYTIEELNKMNDNTKGILTIYDENGDISEYSFIIPTNLKKEIGLDEKGFNVLSEMHSSLFRQQQAIEHNKELFEVLESMNKPFMTGSTIDNKYNYKWVAVDKFTDNKFMNKVYETTDRQLKELLRNYKKDNNYKPLLVREDLVLDIFGQSDISLANKISRDLPMLRNILDISERIMKFIASNFKALIVIKTPIVLFGNIMSNVALAMLQGISPLRIFASYKRNLKYLQSYINDEKKRGMLLIKQSTLGLTTNEKAELNILNTKLKENPVHPLMTRGLMQNIIEDVDTNLDNTDIFNAKLDKFKNKFPKPMQYALDITFMTKNTFLYQTLNKATQYSDFLARMVEYEVKMEQAKKKYSGQKLELIKDKIIDEIRENYINYDKPHSALEQWLNDMGLLLFTKFFKRIQSVIVKFGTDKPVNTILFLLSQFLLIDVPDIFETTIGINKNIDDFFNNPITSISKITVPPIVNTLN